VFQEADALFRNGKFFEAGIEYEYIAYYANNVLLKSRAQSKRIDCFTQENKFEEAQHYAEKVSLMNVSDSLSFEIRYKKAFNAYLAGNFGEAKSHFLQLKFFHPKQVFQKYVLYILILNELNEYTKAKEELLAWIDNTQMPVSQHDSLKLLVQQIYSQRNIPKLKSIERARLFSTFLPGSGQVYAGYPLEGIFNFTIHLATLAFAAEEIIAGYYITGYFGGFGMFQKFYFGGIKRTEYLVNKTNYKRARKFNKEAKAFILEL